MSANTPTCSGVKVLIIRAITYSLKYYLALHLCFKRISGKLLLFFLGISKLLYILLLSYDSVA